MNMTLEMDHDFGQDLSAFFADEGTDSGWHISFRLAPGIRTTGVDPRAMLAALAEMGVCSVIGRDEMLPAIANHDAVSRPVGWDMVLVGNASRAAIENVFAGMSDAMELVIEPIH